MLSDAPVYGKVSTRSLQSRALFVVCARPLFWRKLFRKSISSQRVCCICVLYDITLAKNLRCRQLCVRVLVEGKEKKRVYFFRKFTLSRSVYDILDLSLRCGSASSQRFMVAPQRLQNWPRCCFLEVLRIQNTLRWSDWPTSSTRTKPVISLVPRQRFAYFFPEIFPIRWRWSPVSLCQL